MQTTCFTQNATLINKHGKTPYEMVKEKKLNSKYFHIFGYKCFVPKNHHEHISKFDLKANEGMFVGYPLSTKSFRVYNLRTKVVMESIHVSFDDKKITRLENVNDHDQLRFKYVIIYDDTPNFINLANSDHLSEFIEQIVSIDKNVAYFEGEESNHQNDPQTSEEDPDSSEYFIRLYKL